MRGLSKKKKVKKYEEGGMFGLPPGMGALGIGVGLAPLATLLLGRGLFGPGYKEDLGSLRDEFIQTGARAKDDIFALGAPVGPKTGVQSMRGLGETLTSAAGDMSDRTLATLANTGNNRAAMEQLPEAVAAANQSNLNALIQGGQMQVQADQMEDAQDLAAANLDYQAQQGVLGMEFQNALTNRDALNMALANYKAQGITDAMTAMASGVTGVSELAQAFAGNNYNVGLGEKGMRYIEAEKGGKTEGEFDHDTNKKAIVDEESGQKEGEMTGGELIFNPEQVAKMESLIKESDADGLLAFMKDLLSQPQFQDEEEQMA